MAGFPSLTLINLAQSIQQIAEQNDFLSGLPGNSSVAESARMLATVSVLLSFLLLVSRFTAGDVVDEIGHGNLAAAGLPRVGDHKFLVGAEEIAVEALEFRALCLQ